MRSSGCSFIASPRQLARRTPLRIASFLLDAPVAQHQHSVGHVGDDRVVGDEDGGRAEFAVNALDRLEHEHAGLAVERAGRFVAQQDVRLLRNGARDGDALLLAARKLRREMVQPFAQADEPQCSLRAPSDRVAISVTSATFSSAVRLEIRL